MRLSKSLCAVVGEVPRVPDHTRHLTSCSCLQARQGILLRSRMDQVGSLGSFAGGQDPKVDSLSVLETCSRSSWTFRHWIRKLSCSGVPNVLASWRYWKGTVYVTFASAEFFRKGPLLTLSPRLVPLLRLLTQPNPPKLRNFFRLWCAACVAPCTHPRTEGRAPNLCRLEASTVVRIFYTHSYASGS